MFYLPLEHSVILSTFIKLPFVIRTFVLSIFELPFYTGFTETFFRLNSVEHKPYPAHKCKNAKNCWHFNIYEKDKFLDASTSRMRFLGHIERGTGWITETCKQE